MKKLLNSKITAVILSAIMCFSAVGLTGCFSLFSRSEDDLYELADTLALSFMGNDVYAWNCIAANPEGSFGYVQESSPTWYSYSGLTQSDVKSMKNLLRIMNNELNRYKVSKLSSKGATLYRQLKTTIGTLSAYFNSSYALDFELIGGSYIDSYGGYVADFASAFENYTFRNMNDVQNLRELTSSTKDAFATYLNYAEARVNANYPLYDYTLDNMLDYLNDVIDEGDDYYLYALAESKIDGADFLTAAQKSEYKTYYKAALDNFMSGVTTLANGLERFKGHVTNTERSYLASYGAAGRAYYTYKFGNLTGITNPDFDSLQRDLIDAYNKTLDAMDGITNYIDALTTDSAVAVAESFNEYMDGEKALLDLTEPQEILDYLKEAAKKIVPDLNTMPDIRFKYMDDTAAQKSNALAYYLYTPVDEENSPESITLNPYTLGQESPTELFTTIAHEGYPGHLYAYVNAKESDLHLMNTVFSCTGFAEGWANYAAITILDNIAAEATDEATRLFAQYQSYEMYANYISSFVFDMQINYFGATVYDYADEGDDEAIARYSGLISRLMEIPSQYAPYGYGMYVLVSVHDDVKNALGSDYNEVNFNRALLSEGMGPTLGRAKEIAKEYIAANR